jgi:glycosyltransferase involved in cell wall biosynthesis
MSVSPRLICHMVDANLNTRFFRSIARCHDRERFRVMIGSIAPDGALQEAMRGLGTLTFSLGASARRRYPLALVRLTRMLRHHQVACLHAHCFDPTLIGLIAARLARVPFVFTRHHSDHNIRLGKRWHTAIDGWCARRADAVIAVSEATRQVMMGVERVPDSQITVVYNGMEALPEPSPADLSRVRQELGLDGRPICLMVARLHEEKGHRFLLEALPAILDRVGPITVLCAGQGPYQTVLEAETRARGLQDVVRFLGWREDVPTLLSLATLVVLPSLAESFGFALLEAMSLGKPIAATRIGGIPEVVAHGETGLLIPPADPGALADAISTVLQDPELARTMGEAGRRRSHRSTFEKMMRGYEAVYDRLAAGKTVTPATLLMR